MLHDRFPITTGAGFSLGGPLLPFALTVLCTLSCTTAERPRHAAEGASDKAPSAVVRADSGEQISQYVRCIFQDREGSLWFGTTTDGVCRYDGRSLVYFNAANGFGSDWVNAIGQDAHGDVWFATRDGVVRYDGDRFMRYTKRDGLASDHVWSMLLDRSGGWWFGTYEGVSRFNGRTFDPFAIPAADLSKHPYYEDPKKINAIVDDREGNIWFATNGGGAYRYNGSNLAHFSEKEGLCSDFVNSLLEDRDGHLWFGTRFGGLCTYDGSAFTKVDQQGENQGVLYQQPGASLWTVNMYERLCRRDGARSTCFTQKDGEGVRVPMSLLEDRRGRLWLGTGAGLYRYEAGRFINVTKEMLLGTGGL